MMDERVTELEIRLTHLEDTIDILNRTVIAQHGEIDQLKLQVLMLERKLKAVQENNIAHESEETPPPHY
jgi:SlyX protein